MYTETWKCLGESETSSTFSDGDE